MGTRSVPRQADERRTAAEKGMHVAGASGRGAGTVPAVTSDATQSKRGIPVTTMLRRPGSGLPMA